METQKNGAYDALFMITVILLIGGVGCFLLINTIVGIIAVVLGLVMGIITLVTKAIVNGQQR